MAQAVNQCTYIGPDEITPPVRVFEGIYVGDIVVSLGHVAHKRTHGDLFEVLPRSRGHTLYYDENINSSSSIQWRKATDKEVAWYKSAETNRNIDKMPKEDIINSYSIF